MTMKLTFCVFLLVLVCNVALGQAQTCKERYEALGNGKQPGLCFGQSTPGCTDECRTAVEEFWTNCEGQKLDTYNCWAEGRDYKSVITVDASSLLYPMTCYPDRKIVSTDAMPSCKFDWLEKYDNKCSTALAMWGFAMLSGDCAEDTESDIRSYESLPFDEDDQCARICQNTNGLMKRDCAGQFGIPGPPSTTMTASTTTTTPTTTTTTTTTTTLPPSAPSLSDDGASSGGTSALRLLSAGVRSLQSLPFSPGTDNLLGIDPLEYILSFSNDPQTRDIMTAFLDTPMSFACVAGSSFVNLDNLPFDTWATPPNDLLWQQQRSQTTPAAEKTISGSNFLAPLTVITHTLAGLLVIFAARMI